MRIDQTARIKGSVSSDKFNETLFTERLKSFKTAVDLTTNVERQAVLAEF